MADGFDSMSQGISSHEGYLLLPEYAGLVLQMAQNN